ncbi:MFS transporter [Burkholderia cenocepacia]|nr:MFS transporter [Burkholderia cenocepacia]
MLAQIDKNILVLMVGPIQRDFGVNDVQISFLIGAAFAVANIVAGIPAGWLADRFDRRLIIVGGVVIWSLAVAANAAMTTFSALVIARIVVGGAEALIPPSSYSLIGDGVDEVRRARGLSVYTMSLMLGTGLSLVLGGPLMAAIHGWGLRTLPVIGDVSPWQMTLFLIGVVGLPISLMILLNRDPGRRGDEARAMVQRPATRDIVRVLWQERALLGPLLLFVGANAMITYGLAAWVPTLAARCFALGMKEFGLTQGILMLTAGPIGLYVASQFMQRRQTAISLERVAQVGLASSVAVAILTVFLVLANTLPIFWALDALVVLCSWTFMSVTSVIVSRTVPAQAIGLTMATVLVLNGLVGQGLSPTLIALVGRYGFNGGTGALGGAMATVFAAAGLLSTVASHLMYRRLTRRRMLVTSTHTGMS